MSIAISTTISADTVAEYYAALEKLLEGDKRRAAEKVLDVEIRGEVSGNLTSPSVVAVPEVKEAQAAENAKARRRMEEVIAAADDVELDAHGHPWSAELHASTKGKTQDGLWRMGRGKERPAPMPGYPKSDDEIEGTAPAPVLEQHEEQITGETGNEFPVAEEAVDDEFAQFATATAEPVTEPQEVPARVWSDADVSNAANWAVNSLGGKPEGVVALRDKYIPAGMVPKTMNIPVTDREAFVQDLEKLVGTAYPG